MSKILANPRWRIALLFIPGLFGCFFSALPLQPAMRMIVLACMLALLSIFIIGSAIYTAFCKPRQNPLIYLVVIGYATGFALIAVGLWQMGKTWNLPRAERLSMNMITIMITITLLIFDFFIAATAVMGYLYIRQNQLSHVKIEP